MHRQRAYDAGDARNGGASGCGDVLKEVSVRSSLVVPRALQLFRTLPLSICALHPICALHSACPRNPVEKEKKKPPNHIIPIRIHCLRIEPLLPHLLAREHVLAHPDVPVQAEDEVDVAGEGDEVRLEALDEDGRDGDELAVAELGVGVSGLCEVEGIS